MEPLEAEVDDYLREQRVDFRNNTSSATKLDFTLYLHEGIRFYLEVKEKRQPTKMSQWPDIGIEEKHLFILDDLSARKILRQSPNSGVFIRNNVLGKYYFFDVVTLWSVPRVRVNRYLDREHTKAKGKWLLDLRNSHSGRNVGMLLPTIMRYLENQRYLFSDTACYEYIGEEIGIGGEVRTKEHRRLDINATRA